MVTLSVARLCLNRQHPATFWQGAVGVRLWLATRP